MMTNDKKDELRQKDELMHNIDRVTKGVGAVTTEPGKAVGLVSCWAVLAVFWKARHTLLGYALGDPLAPLKDLLTASISGRPQRPPVGLGRPSGGRGSPG